MLQWFNLIYKCMWIFNVKNRIHCKKLCNFKLIELQWYWLSIYLYAWIDFAIVLIRFTNFEDQAWFNKTMSRVINEELSETHGAMVDSTHYFVDFMKWVTFPMQPLFGLHDLRVTSPWLSFCSFFIFFSLPALLDAFTSWEPWCGSPKSSVEEVIALPTPFFAFTSFLFFYYPFFVLTTQPQVHNSRGWAMVWENLVACYRGWAGWRFSRNCQTHFLLWRFHEVHNPWDSLNCEDSRGKIKSSVYF